MKLHGYGRKRTKKRGIDSGYRWPLLALLAMSAGFAVRTLSAQSATPESLSQQIQDLTGAMARTQAQLEQSQHQLDEMRKQLTELQRAMAQSAASTQAAVSPASSSSAMQDQAVALTAAVQEIREQQALQESQIATHEQSKVESESKYPMRVTGMLLLSGFVNTSGVDIAATPTLAVPGSGSTGATIRQTVLGFDARGPHLFGASSSANLWVDFDGSPQSGSSGTGYSGSYNGNATFLRLRTAYAGLKWAHTEAYFSLDRPVFSPDTPASLTAVAEPALAWSGNLWTWNPQVGARGDVPLTGSRAIRLEAAVMDVGDAPISPAAASATTAQGLPSTAEQSRWPGVEARVALVGSQQTEESSHFGVGGYFAPHHAAPGYGFDSWAGTLDARILLPVHLQLTASFYRGLGLGGLGGGAYKDFGYRADTDSNGYYFRPLDDVGGWAELKERLSQRLELNGAAGIDNVFAGPLRRYAAPGGTMTQNLARNHTYTGNVIYSPNAYLLFSLEYRHLESFPVVGQPASTHMIGLGAGYRF